MQTEEVERKLNQALQLLQEASAALGELKRSEGPAQVMSRIQSAQAMRQPASLAVVRTARRERKERAAFYLHVWTVKDPANDKLFRVIGDGGLMEADKMETELRRDASYKTERLNSRQYQALVETRLSEVRAGKNNVGCMRAEDLRGPAVLQ